MLYFLLLSFLSTNGVNAYFYFSQKDSRKMTISHHAAINKKNHLIFILGHFFGGAFSLFAGYELFYQGVDNVILFYLLLIGIMFEQLQALVPARGKYERAHTLFAAGMSFCIALILLLSPFVISLTSTALLVYLLFLSALVIAGIYTFLDHKKFFASQMLYFAMFYVMVLLLYIGKI